MNFFSLKWKMTLALVLIGFALVASYVFIAKRVFESDKIAYVYESQGSRLVSVQAALEQRIERVLLTGRSLVSMYDPQKSKLNEAGQALWLSEPKMLGLLLRETSSGRMIFQVSKSGELKMDREEKVSNIGDGAKPRVFMSGPDRFVLVLAYIVASKAYEMRVLIDARDLLPRPGAGSVTLLVQNQKVLMRSGESGWGDELLEFLVQSLAQSDWGETQMLSYKSERFLVSSANVAFDDLRIVTITPESVALGALATLYNRSLLFLMMSGALLILISLFLARKLTRSLRVLSGAARKIGQGQFTDLPVIKSRDETGVLSAAFIGMAHEISRLLLETKDKARMEEELKTASLVQESLMPVESTIEFGDIEIFGLMRNSTECGGDWWHYFRREGEIIIAIADATGHGTPAALITAAARSIFTSFETRNLSLGEMMTAWDLAVARCSNKKIFMTGILLKVDIQTGDVHYIAAGHESPFLLNPCAEGGFMSELVDLHVNAAIGEYGMGEHPEQGLHLSPGAALVLYTDGIFSVEKKNGKVLSDRRLGKALGAKAEFARSAKDIGAHVFETFDAFADGDPVPDDITVVVIRRKGLVQPVEIISELGTSSDGSGIR